MAEAYRLNEPLVACEVLDGDMILLHFESGLYYNLRGVGAQICQYLLAGGTPAQAIAAMSAHYSLELRQVEQDVRTFVDELLREALLAPCEPKLNGHPMTIAAGDYAPPRCEKFDDLADQLLLDKIDDRTQDAQWATPPLA